MVLRLRVGTGAKGADRQILASLFDVAKLPAIAAQCERGGGVGAFDYTTFAVEQGEGGSVIRQPCSASTCTTTEQARLPTVREWRSGLR